MPPLLRERARRSFESQAHGSRKPVPVTKRFSATGAIRTGRYGKDKGLLDGTLVCTHHLQKRDAAYVRLMALTATTYTPVSKNRRWTLLAAPHHLWWESQA